MKIQVSENLIRLANACPFPLYVVGGYVRNSLANLKSCVADIDICAPSDAETFSNYAKECGAKILSIYKNTGTVKLKLNEEEYEFAGFRSDEYVRGTHTPTKTFITKDISLDARRRDFKCNAVYYDIKNDKFCDPLGGIEDIKNRRITTVVDADKVFGEDGLRLMRLARQGAELGFVPSDDCLQGAKRNARLILDISVERIWAELNKILHADEKYGVKAGQYLGLRLLDEAGVLDLILPELTAGRGVEQPQNVHKYDVLEHSLRAVLYSPIDVRLAALLHDIGKPYCKTNYGNFYNHEQYSAEMAKEVLNRLKVKKSLISEVVRLCDLHMYDLSGDTKESKIRKLIVNNYDIFDKLLMLKQADFSACMDSLTIAPCVERWRAIHKKMLSEGVPMTLKDLNIKGNDLVELGIEKQLIGKILNNLLIDCAAFGLENEKNKLQKRAFVYAEQINEEE